MVREKDRFWEYVEDLNGRFLCKFCDKSFAGGIPRIKSHLSGVRGRDIEICGRVPEDVRIAALQAICTPKKKARSLISSNNDLETAIISTSVPKKKAKSSHQPTGLKVCEKDQSLADKMLSKFMISYNLSPDVSKTPFLGDLLKSIAAIGPSYKLPSCSALKSHMEMEEYTANVKKFFTTTGCTLIMSKVVENSILVCMNFFAYTPGGLVYVDKITVPEEGMEFQHFTDNVCHIIEYLGPEHVVQFILDDSEDRMVECFTDYKDEFFVQGLDKILMKYPFIYPSRCANGELGVLLMFIYLLDPRIHKTCQLAKLIFKYLYKHDIDLFPRKEQHARNKEYNRSGVTKIAVELFMLHSILDVEKELKALLLPIASVSCEGEGSSGENEVAEVVHKAIHSIEFWNRGKNVVQVLQPFFQVLKLIDGYGSTLGYLYDAMKRVEEAFNEQTDVNKLVSKVFKRRWRRVVQPIHAVADLLNPACLDSDYIDSRDIELSVQLVRILVPIEEREALIKQLRIYCNKDSDLFSATAMKMLYTVHPRKWRECCGDPCPILQKIAVRLLSQTCSTSICDHLSFQQIGLADELRRNMIVMEKFTSFTSQNLELIDLDRISGHSVYTHEFVQNILEDLNCSNTADYHDLLVINDTSDQVPSLFESNDSDDLLDICGEDDWLQSEFNNRDDLSYVINQNCIFKS